jgi:hypothetical protein
MENAVKILLDGNLRSRRDPSNLHPRDVAATGVIDNQTHAHDFVRLYFRPRTPTQWHIEGIRKADECRHGLNSHAPMLIMIVFDARRVLTRNEICFCDRNMQRNDAEIGGTEEYFSRIPFEKVYHEGSICDDFSITAHRCAEVLTPSPLPLADTLQWIYCRTSAERETLLYMLGNERSKWSSKVLVSSDLLLFERRFVFVEDVSLSEKGLIFKLNPRRDPLPVDVEVRIWDAKGTEVLIRRNPNFNILPNKRWLIQQDLQNGFYLVEIKLEQHLAFRCNLSLGDDLF